MVIDLWHGKTVGRVVGALPRAIYEHTEPIPNGYRNRREYRPGERIPVKYAGTDLEVADLIAPA